MTAMRPDFGHADHCHERPKAADRLSTQYTHPPNVKMRVQAGVERIDDIDDHLMIDKDTR